MAAVNFDDHFRDRMGEVERQKEWQDNKNSSFNGLVPQSERRDERLGRLQEAARRNT